MICHIEYLNCKALCRRRKEEDSIQATRVAPQNGQVLFGAEKHLVSQSHLIQSKRHVMRCVNHSPVRVSRLLMPQKYHKTFVLGLKVVFGGRTDHHQLFKTVTWPVDEQSLFFSFNLNKLDARCRKLFLFLWCVSSFLGLFVCLFVFSLSHEQIYAYVATCLVTLCFTLCRKSKLIMYCGVYIVTIL